MLRDVEPGSSRANTMAYMLVFSNENPKGRPFFDKKTDVYRILFQSKMDPAPKNRIQTRFELSWHGKRALCKI